MPKDKQVRLKEGEVDDCMLSASFVNRNVLVPIQALSNMAVIPTGAGKMMMKGEKAVLDLTGLANGKIKDVIIVFNGTARYYTLQGKDQGPVT